MTDYAEEQRKMDRLEAEDYEAYVAMGEVELETSATERIAEQTAERMDKEVRGAWHAGYDYLHVYTPVQTMSWEPTEQFTVTHVVLPSNQPAATGLDHYTYSHSYELADLSRELEERL